MAQPPIGQILMPADMRLGLWLLDDVGDVIEQNIRSDHPLNDIQHRWQGGQRQW